MSYRQDFNEIALALIEEGKWCVELPAGAGKTQLLCSAIKAAALDNKRTLVLTHTNAGVAAIEKRCRELQVDPRSYSIRTISAWCEFIARSYCGKTGLDSRANRRDDGYFPHCTRGVIELLSLKAIAKIIELSYEALLVDEYQDCSLLQHELITLLGDHIPTTVILGDRLQRIFDFRNEPFPDWENDVLRAFRTFDGITPVAYRWEKTNPDLGEWLLHEVRPALLEGREVDLEHAKLAGYGHLGPAGDRARVAKVARKMASCSGSSLIICPNLPPGRINKVSKSLGGIYNQMEEIEGKFMWDKLSTLDSLVASGDKARWLALYAKDCFSGLSKVLDQPVLTALEKCEGLQRYTSTKARAAFVDVLSAFESAAYAFTKEAISRVSESLYSSPAKIIRKEAWEDALHAARLSVGNGGASTDAFEAIRERRKHFANRSEGYSVSKTLLVKGLEFDNVMVLHTEEHGAYSPENLYVALTRPTSNLLVFS